MPRTTVSFVRCHRYLSRGSQSHRQVCHRCDCQSDRRVFNLEQPNHQKKKTNLRLRAAQSIIRQNQVHHRLAKPPFPSMMVCLLRQHPNVWLSHLLLKQSKQLIQIKNFVSPKTPRTQMSVQQPSDTTSLRRLYPLVPRLDPRDIPVFKYWMECQLI